MHGVGDEATELLEQRGVISLAIDKRLRLETLTGDFGLSITLEGPTDAAPLNLAAVIKPLFDGTIAALDCEILPNDVAIGRLGTELGVDRDDLKALLTSPRGAVLGGRRGLLRERELHGLTLVAGVVETQPTTWGANKNTEASERARYPGAARCFPREPRWTRSAAALNRGDRAAFAP
jgi:hypothetical protein